MEPVGSRAVIYHIHLCSHLLAKTGSHRSAEGDERAGLEAIEDGDIDRITVGSSRPPLRLLADTAGYPI
jgi:hypothetical protein